MTQETYTKHKQDLEDGKIAVLDGGRTASSVDELDDIYEAQGGSPFGQSAVVVMAIDSGRMSPEMIESLGPDDSLVVAAHHLTEDQLDALTDKIMQPFQKALDNANTIAADRQAQVDDLTKKLTVSESKLTAAEAKAKAASEVPPVEQAVQAQMATGANAAVTPKTAIDNKTDATTPAGKNASKTDGDAAQTAEAETAKTS